MVKASCSSVGSRRKMKAAALGIGGIAMAEEAAAACDGGCRRERGGVIASGDALLQCRLKLGNVENKVHIISFRSS